MAEENTNLAMKWPYPIKYEEESEIETDVLIIGGGIAGCHAALSAARKGARVTVVDKSAVKISGSGGLGVDHWHGAIGNPCCPITPEEWIEQVDEYDYGVTSEFGLGPICYILGKESYDAMVDVEELGGQVRDVNDAFKGAEFRDDETQLMFAYDYDGKHCIRVFGSGIKAALYKGLKKVGVRFCEHVMVTSLLNENGKQGARIAGATGVNVRTGEFYVFKAKATVISSGRANHIWDFSTERVSMATTAGDPNCAGDGYVMAYQAGAELTMMEASLPAMGSGYFPRYGQGNAHNTWYACTLVDANGKEIPWVDRNGNRLNTVSERYRTLPGQKFFLFSRHYPFMPIKYRGPSMVLDLKERILNGEFTLPFYADLPGMPEHERRAIFGLMVGNEGKSRIPVYDIYTKAGFDPDKDLLQNRALPVECMKGRKSRPEIKLAPQARTFGFVGGYGGLLFDWDLKTSLDGLYVAGEPLAGGANYAASATSGRYAGRKAAQYALDVDIPGIVREQIDREKTRVYAPTKRTQGMGWKELQMGLCRIMQEYCGEYKSEENLKLAQKWLADIQESEASGVFARNPHELQRSLECLIGLEMSQIIVQASMARKASSKDLGFTSIDYPQVDPDEWKKYITIKSNNGEAVIGELPLNYWLKPPYASTYAENYQIHCGL
jgi:succinate dehydrogenase/fumarate reductase flavoprotein subunit